MESSHRQQLQEHRQRLAHLRTLPEGMETGGLERLIRDLEARIEMVENRHPLSLSARLRPGAPSTPG